MVGHGVDSVDHISCWCYFFLQGGRRGRGGARTKYVDVLNPGGGGTISQAPPPPALAPVGLGMPLGGSQPFTGNLFVPQPIPGTCTACGVALPGDTTLIKFIVLTSSIVVTFSFTHNKILGTQLLKF